jgi:hypothetical protein
MLGPAGRQNGRESHTGGDCSGVDGMEGARASGSSLLAGSGRDETSVGGSLRTARMSCVSAFGGLGRATAQGGSAFHGRRQANTKASWSAGQGTRHAQAQGHKDRANR